MSKRTRRPATIASTRSHGYSTTCTVQRDDGSFCGQASMPDLPASICPKHAARIFLHLREYAGKADRTDVAMRLVRTMESQARATYAAAPARKIMSEVVYYVRVGDHVKIGYTMDLKARMKAYPTGRLLAVEQGDGTLERKRHQQFADALDVGREWFRMTPDLMAHIETLAPTARRTA